MFFSKKNQMAQRPPDGVRKNALMNKKINKKTAIKRPFLKVFLSKCGLPVSRQAATALVDLGVGHQLFAIGFLEHFG